MFENFFDINTGSTFAFDESPKIKVQPTGLHTGSLNTSLIDAFRQGVEITLPQHFEAGCVKLTSGERGHVIARIAIGVDDGTRNNVAFSEPQEFDDLFVDAGFDEQGVLEPLTIRNVVRFRTNERTPFHSVKSSLGGGNEDQRSASDVIVNNAYVNGDPAVPFLDENDPELFVDSTATNERAQLIDTFFDERIMENDDGLSDSTMETFVEGNRSMVEKQVLGSCGWIDPEGTTSINYVDQIYR